MVNIIVIIFLFFSFKNDACGMPTLNKPNCSKNRCLNTMIHRCFQVKNIVIIIIIFYNLPAAPKLVK